MPLTEDREKELKSAITERKTAIDECINSPKIRIDNNNVEVPQELADTIKQKSAEIDQIYALLQSSSANPEERKQLNGEVEGKTAESLALQSAQQHQFKSLSRMFVESPEFKDFVRTGAKEMNGRFTTDMADVCRTSALAATKDVYAGMVDGASIDPRNMGGIQFDPMVPRAYRQARVRDLFPVARTVNSLIEFYRVLGYANGQSSAASVPDRTGSEFTTKPKSNLEFEQATAPVRTLAHWEAAHRNVLDDVPQLRSTIDNELLYGLQLEEDRQILGGSGNNDELLGVLNTPGIQSYTQASGELKSDALRRAATRVILANYPATGFVLHPHDWEDIELQKGGNDGSSGDGQYMLVTNIAVGAAAQVWRQPVVETAAMSQGTFLTGAFGLGAQLYDRAQASVRISEHHASYFVQNAIAILAEQRLALATKRPESFVKGTFSGVTT